MNIKINKTPFGKTCTGESAELWTVDSPCGISLSLTNWGATIVKLVQPDKNGNRANIVLGFDDASQYLPQNGYFGATCGRYANRIANGTFTLDGKTYKLNCNQPPNHLHGGNRGFNAVMWDAKPFTDNDVRGIEFSRISPDGEEAYPGELDVKVRYGLDNYSRLYMDFQAVTDKPTIINITNHAYWNLSGNFNKDVLNTMLKLTATHFIPVNNVLIPYGTTERVDDTPYDFRKPGAMGRNLKNAQGGGYDVCLTDMQQDMRPLAMAWDTESGRQLTLSSNRPGFQFYTGNNLAGSTFPQHTGFCLEPQNFPDAPNHPLFPSAVLRPGEYYNHQSVFEFSIHSRK